MSLSGARAIVIAAAMTATAHSAAFAQVGPEAGSHELQIWSSGGHGINGTFSDTGLWSVGGRYGWVLTGLVGPGPLRGRFEYAVDLVPVFLVLQKTGAAYGFALNPFALKWNFATRHNIVPYVDIGGGTLFTNEKTPPGTSHVNFTSGGAVGLHFLRNKNNWSAEVRFTHISNAGLVTPNRGINTVEVRLGFGRFRPRK